MVSVRILSEIGAVFNQAHQLEFDHMDKQTKFTKTAPLVTSTSRLADVTAQK